MTITQVLAEAGISKDHPDWGTEYNLCHAAMYGGLGVRNGSCEAVMRVLAECNLAPLDPKKVREFCAVIGRMLMEATNAL